jgi:hypothetical protein
MRFYFGMNLISNAIHGVEFMALNSLRLWGVGFSQNIYMQFGLKPAGWVVA